MLNTLSREIQLNSLFIQPTYWCAINCSGCYVKERNIEKKIVSMPRETIVDFIKKVLVGTDIKVNELTISMDDLSQEINQYEYMRGIFRSTIGFLEHLKDQDSTYKPKVNMTFHTIPTYLKYLGHWVRNLNEDWKDYLLNDNHCFTEEKLIEKMVYSVQDLNMISFSHLDFNPLTKRILKEIRDETTINYNLLIPRRVNNSNIRKHFQHLIDASENVDHIYLVIKKDPIGKGRSSITKEKSEKNMRDDLYYINYMSAYLPNRILNKIDIDGCVQDIKKYNKSGHGCSSNIS